MPRHSKSVARWLRLAHFAIDRIDRVVDPETDRLGPELGDLVMKIRRLQVKVRFAPPPTRAIPVRRLDLVSDEDPS